MDVSPVFIPFVASWAASSQVFATYRRTRPKLTAIALLNIANRILDLPLIGSLPLWLYMPVNSLTVASTFALSFRRFSGIFRMFRLRIELFAQLSLK